MVHTYIIMKGFNKDILLIDFEGTGLDLENSEPTQIGAVLLDKVTLAEKDNFVSYIAVNHPDKITEDAVRISGITAETLIGAPSRAEVASQLFNKFGVEVFLASWNSSFDQAMLTKLLKSVNKDLFTYDYHYLDIWPLAYMYLVKQGKGDIIRSEPTFRYFDLPPRKVHDALEDCRHTAEVLRKVYNE